MFLPVANIVMETPCRGIRFGGHHLHSPSESISLAIASLQGALAGLFPAQVPSLGGWGQGEEQSYVDTLMGARSVPHHGEGRGPLHHPLWASEHPQGETFGSQILREPGQIGCRSGWQWLE